MGCILSKKNKSQSDSKIPPVLASYESELQKDTSLHSFDKILRENTKQAIQSIAESPSLDTLLQATGSLANINGQVVQLILQSKEDIRKNRDLFDLVEEYFSSSNELLTFYAALDNCITEVKKNHNRLESAITQFDEEKNDQGGNRFSKTLQELDHFISAGDPFTKEFFALFRPVYNQQVSMLSKLQAKKKNLDWNLKRLRSFRKVSSVLFAAAFAAVVIGSALVAAIAAPLLVGTLFSAISAPIVVMGEWMSSLWKAYEDEVKKELKLVVEMEIGSLAARTELENIKMLAKKLKNEIETMLSNARFAVEGEDQGAVSLAIDEIKKNLGAFTEAVELLGKQSEQYSRDVMRARDEVLQKIKNS